MKRYYLYFVFLFAAIFITFSLANIASALSIKKWDYHVKDNYFGTMNTAVNIYNAAHGTDFKNIVKEYWASNKTEVEGDYKTWVFDNLLGVEYLRIKAGKKTELFYVGDVGTGSFTWEGTKGLSHFSTIAPAPVPEPSTILLIGTGLTALVAFKRRKSIKT
jgi:hypothetical protein